MYSGTTISSSSGKILGAHQKLDRVARRCLEKVLPETNFPSSKEILHFEGKNGPDAIKRKSPAQDEPWHYYDPANPGDDALITMIENHTTNLIKALKKGNQEKAAFEAAWLAHAIVDGLTPAHHYSLERVLEELRGEGLETRTTLKDKLLIRQEGDTKREVLQKNWQYWGAKGVMTTHGMFEMGVATTIAPLRLIKRSTPDGDMLVRVRSEGVVPQFKDAAAYIYSLNMYERFHKKGWTKKLARQTRLELAPIIARTVALAWYAAAYRAYGGKN